MTGRLVIERSESTPLTRDVSADTCQEAVAALAFVVALSLEPDGAQTTSAPPDPSSARAPRPTPRSTWSISAGAPVSFAIAPSAASGVFAAGETTGPVGVLRPSVRGTASFLTSGAISIGDLEASFRTITGRVDLCPSSTKMSIVRLSPCAGLELGSLRAVGGGVDHPIAEARFWSVAYVLGRARIEPLARLFVELEAGAALPLTPRRFAFDNPAIEIFTTPRVAVAGAIGLGVYFP